MLPVFVGKVYLIKDVSDNAVFYKDEKWEDQKWKHMADEPFLDMTRPSASSASYSSLKHCLQQILNYLDLLVYSENVIDSTTFFSFM